MSKNRHIFRFAWALLFAFAATCFLRVTEFAWLLIPAVIAFAAVNLMTGFFNRNIYGFRLNILNHGAETLIVFLLSVCFSIFYYILILNRLFSDWKTYLISILICIFAHIVLFWNGIICVYLSSVQLGIKQRVIGALLGFIPILNLFALKKIIKVCLEEVKFESEKEKLNRSRKESELCKTRYPILFVHGVFFRDNKNFDYWGRIPKELIRNGATVYYGNHQSALSVADSAEELSARIKEIIKESGCEKINIIAHSKGGLDCRYAIEHCKIGDYVASLTTVNTPHRGCLYADYLLEKAPASVQAKVADAYNKAALKLGDTTPDFMAAVKDLRACHCKENYEILPLPEGIYCQSIGTSVKRGADGRFLKLIYPVVKHFDGTNDGLVSTASFSWGEKYTYINPEGKRGISHMDIIDLTRQNLPEFDVREFYVNLVSDLKKKGL